MKYLSFCMLIALLCNNRPLSSQAQPLLGAEITSEEELFLSTLSNRQWPSYRGYMACGFLNNAHLPDSFHVESGYNIKWKTEVPGLGLSCPVIWDDQVYITTAISQKDLSGYQTGIYGDIQPVNDSSEHSWKVLCYDKNSGELRWEKEAFRGIPTVKRHPKSSHANTSICTDGYHVIAFFGSEGLYCYNHQGRLLWKRDLGPIISAWDQVPSAEWEFSSSPLIFQDKLLIQADALNTAFVAALDLKSGKTLWRKEREEIPNWCSPNIYFDGEQPRMVVNGFKHRGAYDLNTGEEIWRMSGGGDIPVPTPIVWKDLIFFNSAHGYRAPLMALRNSATGRIKYPGRTQDPPPEILWLDDRAGAYMTSVVIYDSLLYQLRWNGNLTCMNPRTGKLHYRETIRPTSFIASPVIADQRIYLLSEEGDLYIVACGNTYKLLKKLPLGETSLVTPAISEGMLIFRTSHALIAVSE